RYRHVQSDTQDAGEPEDLQRHGAAFLYSEQCGLEGDDPTLESPGAWIPIPRGLVRGKGGDQRAHAVRIGTQVPGRHPGEIKSIREDPRYALSGYPIV